MIAIVERNELLDYLVDQLAPLGDARGRCMFGGHGVYLDGLIIGIIAFDTFYLKVDGDNRADFEAAGAAPFVYDGKDKPIVMPYWECPAEVMEDSDRLRAWALRSLAASRRSRKPATGNTRPRRRRSR
jgi:DNA transformation protein